MLVLHKKGEEICQQLPDAITPIPGGGAKTTVLHFFMKLLLTVENRNKSLL